MKVVLLLNGSAELKTKVMPFIKSRCVAAYLQSAGEIPADAPAVVAFWLESVYP